MLGRSTLILVRLGCCLLVGACSVPASQSVDKETGFLRELPEGVAAIAAPYQNLQEVVLKPEDGCYWYRHVGPVETTMLPLRTVAGRPICTKAAVQSEVTG
jgi:hypothetical protein